MELPVSKLNDILYKYRGITPSGEITEFIKDAITDIVTLYTIINDNTNQLQELELVSNIENRYLYNYITELEQQLKAKDLLLQSGEVKTIHINPIDCMPSYQDTANISNEFSQITPNSPTYVSKIYLHDDMLDKNILSPTTTIGIKQTITPSNSNATYTESDKTYLLDGNSNTCWQRAIKIPKDDKHYSIDLTITIPLPYDISATRTINTISLIPHPIKAIDIVSIEYKQGEVWSKVKGFKDHPAYNPITKSINSAKPLRLYFEDTNPTDIRIQIRQDKFIEEVNDNIYYMGIYAFEVGYTTCNTIGKFIINKELLGNTNIITEIIPKFDNQSLIDNNFSYTLYYIDNNEVPKLVTNNITNNGIQVDSNKIMLECIIHQDDTTIPALNSIDIKYKILN